MLLMALVYMPEPAGAIQLKAQQADILAVDGILYLSAVPLPENGIIALDGEWRFYWKQLLTPQDL